MERIGRGKCQACSRRGEFAELAAFIDLQLDDDDWEEELAGKKKWQPLYTFGDAAELYALDNTQPGWHQRLLRVLAHSGKS